MRVVALFLLALVLPLLPFLLWLGRRKSHVSPADVADTLEAFLTAGDRPHDWDRFLSSPLADPTLDAVRLRCRRLPEEFPPKGAGEYCSDAGKDVIRQALLQLRQAPPGDGQQV
jgi:hypothetical protein